MQASPSGAEQELRRRITDHGPVTFAEFMDVALHWPRGGYYATRQALGAEGDFYTAPLTHPVFGALIARQLAGMWGNMGSPSPFWAVELGAGSGVLAADVTRASAEIDDGFARALCYVCVDAAPPPAGTSVARWARSSGLPVARFTGVVLANELLDAFPVHRVTVDSGVLREIRVGVAADGAFEEVLVEAAPALVERLDALDVTLSEGFRAEVCLALDSWAADVASSLERGYLLLIDYGHEARAYYEESRRRGTLRCYYQHTLNMDPYRRVGRQDISVHVETTSLRHAASNAGLAELGATSQTEFLKALGFDAYRDDIARRPGLGAVTRTANLRALDTLVDADGMGAFRVLAFSKGVVPADGLPGFASDSTPVDVTSPLATSAHLPLGGVSQGQPMPTWNELLR
jgi:SAM-dependent MidA family methyltransferase